MRNRTKMEAKYVLKRTVCGLLIAMITLYAFNSFFGGQVRPPVSTWILGMGGAAGFGWGWYRGVYAGSFRAVYADYWETWMKVNPIWIVVWTVIGIVAFLFSGYSMPPD